MMRVLSPSLLPTVDERRCLDLSDAEIEQMVSEAIAEVRADGRRAFTLAAHEPAARLAIRLAILKTVDGDYNAITIDDAKGWWQIRFHNGAIIRVASVGK